jgi:riboflavin synthase
MFTGIIQSTGKIVSKETQGESIRFKVQPGSPTFLKDVNTGDSISINGACMTVENHSEGFFNFTTIHESLTKTNLGLLEEGSFVNLEKAMTMQSKLDGHIVQGHVDTTGIVTKVVLNDDIKEYFIKFSSDFRNNVIYVGSISINGVSLTVAEIAEENNLQVTVKAAIIPHTYEVTTFKHLKEGDKVNIEFDMIGKYVERIIKGRDALK